MNNIVCVLKAEWVDMDKTVASVILRVRDVKSTVPFTFKPYTNDRSDIHRELLHMFQTGQLHIAEPDMEKIENERIARMSRVVRSRRDSLLSETDYLVNADYPITEEQRAELLVYRQALRDITQQEGFPDNVVWPVKPAFVK